MAIARKAKAAAGKRGRITRPSIFKSDGLQREQFTYHGDVHIRGDVDVDGQMIVGGNLTVDGDLRVDELFCPGHVRVRGDIHGGYGYVGLSIEAAGDVYFASLETGHNADALVDLLRWEDGSEDDPDLDAIDKLAHPHIVEEQEEERERAQEFFDYSVGAVIAGGELEGNFLEAKGNVSVGGNFDMDEDAKVAGDLNVGGGLYTQIALTVYGTIRCGGDINCDDEIYAGSIVCDGNIRSMSTIRAEYDVAARGSIRTGELLSADGSIQAGKWMWAYGGIAAGNYVKAGEYVLSFGGIVSGADYGVLAGLCVPRSEWPCRGFVGASEKPAQVLTGVFIAGLTEDDIEDGIGIVEQ